MAIKRGLPTQYTSNLDVSEFLAVAKAGDRANDTRIHLGGERIHYVRTEIIHKLVAVLPQMLLWDDGTSPLKNLAQLFL